MAFKFVGILKRSWNLGFLQLQNRAMASVLDEFGKDNVRIRDPNFVNTVLSQFKLDGQERLHVIADFDYTITKSSNDEGAYVPDSYGVIQETNEFYRKRAKSITQAQYFMDRERYNRETANMTDEQKAQLFSYSDEAWWWILSNKLIVELNINRDDISKMVKESSLTLRDNFHHFQQTLSKNNVPLLIFSAGLGDVIEETLKLKTGTYPNETIISNFMHFDETTGKIKGFKGNLIHSYNKTIEKQANDVNTYLEKIENRSNILVLGDNPTDLQMTDGLDNVKNILTIGFLNLEANEETIEDELTEFMEKFDIVLINDQTMTVPNAILNAVLAD